MKEGESVKRREFYQRRCRIAHPFWIIKLFCQAFSSVRMSSYERALTTAFIPGLFVEDAQFANGSLRGWMRDDVPCFDE